MVRKHGWQLPAHTFQVVAITVFCLLVVAFYAFFAPFLGGRIWEYVLVGTYSPVALLVCILYVRCTAINPADPGIMSKFISGASNKPNKKLAKDLPIKIDDTGSGTHSSPSSFSKSSTATSRKGSVAAIPAETTSRKSCSNYLGGILCALFIHEDCRKQEGMVDQQATGEDALYCTLCTAEVRKFSKHCRSCDKCVDGFDHHCRWLNNCVGYKNYVTFISLMALSLVWLVIEVGVGIAVLVRCFVNKKSMHSEIIDRLGNGFSRAPFATVVAVCTAVSILACLPLGELFFFHMILIRKGITTYEYVVAMRAMSEAPPGGSVDEEMPNIIYSPSGSATTGVSGGSSLGLQYKGAWCTPPRVFVDYQDEVVPHLDPGMVPSTVDPDAAGSADRGTKASKRPIRISAWKLAKLDSTEAMKAAAKARASSSVLKQVNSNSHLPDHEFSSSENMSVRSSVSTETGVNKDLLKNGSRSSPIRNSFAQSQGSRDEYETGTQSASSFSSPTHIHESVTLSPLPQSTLPRVSMGFDEKIMQTGNIIDPMQSTSILRDVRRTSVVWDQEAGRYVSVPASVTESRNKLSLQIGLPTSRRPTQESSSSSAAPKARSENLTYTGESIFYGGPLVPVRDSQVSERSLERVLPRETRFRRDSASSQLPVFVPVDYEHNAGFGSSSK